MTRSPKSNANQLEIAKAAGVSVSTVSRALSDARGISDERRMQIRKIAEDAGYLGRTRSTVEPTRHLRAYVTGSLATGGLAPFYEAVIGGLRDNARDGGFSLSIRMVDETSLGPQRMARDQEKEEASATIFVGIDLTADLAKYFLNGSQRAVLVNGYDPDMRFDCVAPNNFYGARMAGRALLQAGHRKLLYIHDHTRWTTTQRRRGFYAALEDYADASSLAIGVANGVDADLLAEVERRARGESEWTSVFCANDMAAFRLMNALEAAGLSVPGEVSVIGFDDLPYAAMMHPRLTTMRVNCFEMAHQAILLAQRRIAEPDAMPIQIECAVTLQPGATIAQIA
ncbi:MAG: LacI family transcriptional regulator [Rhizobium sp.]|nr:MAG: LacI family transcriptional regulator [Rhizobium sp.]